MKKKTFFGFDYFKKLAAKYPGSLTDTSSPVLFMGDLFLWLRQMKSDDDSERFCSIKDRGFTMDLNATRLSRRAGFKWQSASQTYKGLLNFKTPFDLQLYSSLIWELKPKTIIEFGSLQGGSALWFADQLQATGVDGHVHSFELFVHAIHKSAKSNKRITFHKIDLRNISKELDTKFLLSLPRPWLVIDDAHANMEQVVSTVSKLLLPGDYYVIEDLFLQPFWTSLKNLNTMVDIIDQAGLIVDTKYTDAFGYNATCAPNSWLKKV